MGERLMREGLRHDRNWSGDEGKFFAAIDEHGGWPVGYQYVGFVHSDGREAGYCNSPNNDGWWTVVASANDYYLWKLSPAYLQGIVDAAINAARVTRVDAQRIHIESWRGFRAVVRKPEEPAQ